MKPRNDKEKKNQQSAIEKAIIQIVHQSMKSAVDEALKKIFKEFK